jgi:hypothetical protein
VLFLVLLRSQFPRPGVLQHENDAVLALIVVPHLYSVASLSQNLLIRNKDYVPVVFYSPLLSSLLSSAELTRLSSLYRIKSSSDPSRLFEMLHFLKLFYINLDEYVPTLGCARVLNMTNK